MISKDNWRGDKVWRITDDFHTHLFPAKWNDMKFKCKSFGKKLRKLFKFVSSPELPQDGAIKSKCDPENLMCEEVHILIRYRKPIHSSATF